MYDQKHGNLFVHHDIPLPSYPLCIAHGQVGSDGNAGNYCAVGTFSPGIEVWNLDVLNALEPSCILGGEDTTASDRMLQIEMLRAKSGAENQKISQQVSSEGLRKGSHEDAVIALSWNKLHHQVIASGSADKTIKLWDITKSSTHECNASTFTHHRDKVQCVEWHPKEGTLLATGSFDRTVALLDARNGAVKSVRLASDCEAIAWDPTHSEYLTVLAEDGTICCWDVRQFQTSTPLWSFSASEFGGINNLAYNPSIPGMLATCGNDECVVFWDAYSKGNAPTANKPPTQCGTKKMCVGRLFTVGFYPSSAWLLSCGGSGNEVALWDLSSESVIQSRYKREGTVVYGTENSGTSAEDFEAMMAGPKTTAKTSSPEKKKNSKKNKGSAKKKAHRKGR